MKKFPRTAACALLIFALCTLSFLLFSCGEETPMPSELLTDESGNTLDLSSNSLQVSEEPSETEEPTATEAPTETDSIGESASEAESESESESESGTEIASTSEKPSEGEPTRDPAEIETTDAVYADADITSLPTVTIEKTADELKAGVLFDTSVSAQTVTVGVIGA